MTLLAGLVAAVALASTASQHGAIPQRSYDVRAFGAAGDGRTDDSSAFQAALDAARLAGGGVVHVPAGTYVVAPPGPMRALAIGSHVRLRGDGPSSVLKVKPGTGSYRALLSNYPQPTSHVEDVTISDLRIDQDCGESGGWVEPGAEGHEFFVYVAWDGEGIRIERVRFDAVCGIHTISINGVGVRDAAVRDSTFRFVRGPTHGSNRHYDNTAVYLHGRDTAATGNVFESTAEDGARGAIELHGARGTASRNITRWYHSCARVVGTSERGETPPARNDFVVSHNTCLDANDAINVWSVTGHGIRGVTIVDNTIRLAPEQHLASTHLRYFMGISFVWDAVSPKMRGEVRDALVERNTIEVGPTDPAHYPESTGSGGIMLMNAGDIVNVSVRRNTIRGSPTEGIRLESKGRGTVAAHVVIEENHVSYRGDRPGAPRAGITAAGRLQDVTIARNTVELPSAASGRALRAEATGAGGVRVAENNVTSGVASPSR